MNTADILNELQKKALKDEELRRRFLETANSKEPLDDFCKICTY